MSLPPDDLAPHIARRRHLQNIMRAAGGGIALLPAARAALRNRDAEYPHRQDSDFLYLTGFPEADARLVLIAGDTDRAVLFCRDKNEARELWEGRSWGPERRRRALRLRRKPTRWNDLDEMLPGMLLDQAHAVRAAAARQPHRRRACAAPPRRRVDYPAQAGARRPASRIRCP